MGSTDSCAHPQTHPTRGKNRCIAPHTNFTTFCRLFTTPIVVKGTCTVKHIKATSQKQNSCVQFCGKVRTWAYLGRTTTHVHCGLGRLSRLETARRQWIQLCGITRCGEWCNAAIGDRHWPCGPWDHSPDGIWGSYEMMPLKWMTLIVGHHQASPLIVTCAICISGQHVPTFITVQQCLLNTVTSTRFLVLHAVFLRVP